MITELYWNVDKQDKSTIEQFTFDIHNKDKWILETDEVTG